MARLIMNPCLESVLIMLLTPREKEEKKNKKKRRKMQKSRIIAFCWFIQDPQSSELGIKDSRVVYPNSTSKLSCSVVHAFIEPVIHT
jgi:hypothetical protein